MKNILVLCVHRSWKRTAPLPSLIWWKILFRIWCRNTRIRATMWHLLRFASIRFLFLAHSFLPSSTYLFLFVFAHLLSSSIVHHAARQAICLFRLCLFAGASFQLIYFFTYSSVGPSIIFSPKTYFPFIFPSIYSLLASQPYKWCSRDEIFLSFLKWNLINLR